MPKYPKPREMPGFEVYFVTVDRGRIQRRMAEGWEIHPDYQEAYNEDPKACDSWPMRRAVGTPEPEAAPVAVNVEESTEVEDE